MARLKVIESRFGFRYGGQSDPDLIERSLSVPCPKFEPVEPTPSNCDKQSGISSSTKHKLCEYVGLTLSLSKNPAAAIDAPLQLF